VPERRTVLPVAGAAENSVTVQVVVAFGATVVGLQFREVTGTPGLPTPPPPPLLLPLPLPIPPLTDPVPAIAIKPPEPSTPSPPPRETVKLETAAANANVIVATVPFAMTFEFIPLAMQVYEPLFMVQEGDFPAAVREGPGTMVAVKTEAPGNVSCQSSAAGSEPEGEEIDTPTENVPTPLLKGEMVRESDCP
jgi:hypothetical protein